MKEISKFQELFKNMILNIEKRINLYAFIIFGSRARGNALYYSDFDILIIADFKEKYINRSKWVVQIAPEVPIDVFCYTPKEFKHLFHQYNLTTIDAIDEGIFLKGKDYLEEYIEKLSLFKQKGLKKKNHLLIPPTL
ncbi:MAG: nucleotidyltransferase domain-containing protein [Candidatus Lokiarchaeota archaeon]|nr:nucleotidyltransferase domain-containing protein [Candidatus Lokiarchaeota archaeon]